MKTILAGILFTWFGIIDIQNDVLGHVNESIKAGNAKELVKDFAERVEIKIDGKASTYSRQQAELVLKDIFTKMPGASFNYIHQGNSPEGSMKYAIGKFVHKDVSYRIYILFKKTDNRYMVDTFDMSKE